MSLVGTYPEAMPHDRLNIYDQSGYTERIPSEVVKDPIACIPFISERGVGPDNKFVIFNDPGSILSYGTPNIAKYGISMYTIEQYLLGGGSVLGMRLMPEDATHANLVLLAKHKVLEDIPVKDDQGRPLYRTPEGEITTVETGNTAIVKDMLDIKYSVTSINGEDAKTPAAIKAKMETLKVTVADVDGYVTTPVLTFYAKAKGLFANNLAVRLSSDPTMEVMMNSNRFYRTTVIENSSSVGKQVSFTLPDSIFGNESMQIEDAMDVHSPYVGTLMSKEYAATLIPAVQTVAGADVNTNLIDILFGISKNDTAEEYVSINSESVSLTIVSGIKLAGGSDGIFGTATDKAAEHDKLFLKFYKGEIDDSVKNSMRRPFRHLFDVSESVEVKNAMVALAESRHSTFAFVSAPTSFTTYTEVLAFRSSGLRYGLFKAGIYPESVMIVDQYTGKKVRVNSSYMMAGSVAKHCQNTGFSVPFYGEKNGFEWSGYIPGSIRPQTQDPAVYTALHKARVNQMVEVSDGVAQPYQQITTQSGLSALSEINNVHTLFNMIDIALDYSKSNRGSNNEDSDIADFVTGLKTIIDDRLRGVLGDLSIIAERESANGAGANRIRCRYDIRFKNQLKGVTYEFYIH